VTLRIDTERLWQRIQQLAKIGAYFDEDTGLTGVNRLALTDADKAGREQMRAWFEEAGLEVRTDRIGNTFGRRAGRDADAAPVMSGSHIDSVPTGGAFDGSLGVLAALECIRALNDAGIETRRPIEVAFFTDEEGARFGTDMLGSAVACGRIELEEALGLRDRAGRSVGDELERIGFRGDAPERLSPPHAFVELHVEQGPVLASESYDLGVVTGVQAISWQRITIVGKAAHAGTTPTKLRADAGLAAARLNLAMHEMATSGRFGEEMRATMGSIELAPNRVNIVPSRAVCTVDLRNPDDEQMKKAERELRTQLGMLAHELGVQVGAHKMARTAAVQFDAGVQDKIAAHIDGLDLKHRRIQSGAGHDAQEFAAICPTAMIFVPGDYDGISHNPREFSSEEACGRGAQVLLQTLQQLADE
jgi:N-carbamoyl-L-amino-acid hydrolase